MAQPIFHSKAGCRLFLTLFASSAMAATVTVRSGNGNLGGRDSAVTFLVGPANSDFSPPLSAVDFASAQRGPAAFIISPFPLWLPSLSTDSTAKWIGSSSTSSSTQSNTAVYATSFVILNPFSSATLTLHYAVDDGLGAKQQVVYLNGHAVDLNGNPACTTIIGTANQFAQEDSAICNNIAAFLQVGTNWLYFDDVNLAGEAGIVFSATITTLDVLVSPQPSIASLTPAMVAAASDPLTLTINGSGFYSSSSVTFNGTSHATTLVNAGQLSITLGAPDLAVPGSFPVAVINPSPGGGRATIPLTVTTPSPIITAVVNAASFHAGPISPGEIVTIAGTNLGPATPAGLTLDQNGKVATSIGGVKVLFGGFPAPLTYVSSTQINAVVPYEVQGLLNPSAQAVYQGQTSNVVALTPAATVPALFTFNGSGTGPAAALNQDQTYNTPNNPAPKGSVVVLYMTGEGQTAPLGVTGGVTAVAAMQPVTPQPVLPIAALVGGQPASILFDGEAPGLVSGVMQLNIQIPPGVPSGNLPIIVSVGGNSSQTGVTVSVQ